MTRVPDSRLRIGSDQPVRDSGHYVLYWMIATRRPVWNFALDHALAHARSLKKPLLVFEPLRCGYRWASDRIHRFVCQGMAQNKAAFADAGVTYYPYLEPKKDADKGLLHALAEKACLVVSDDYPAFFLPRMLAAQRDRLPARLELVDSNGLLPMHIPDRDFPTAYAFRRYLQKTLPDHLHDAPTARPLARVQGVTGAKIPASIVKQWPAATAEQLAATPAALKALPIDHAVGPASIDGGYEVGFRVAKDFVKRKLPRYGDDRNDPDADGSSGLSPYLHFGHASVHAIFHDLTRQEKWDITDVATKATGSREGFWGMSAPAEAFLDEVVTWREIGFNKCVQCPDTYDRYDALPDWAKTTLKEHAKDKREETYTLAQLERAETDDPVWNAAQNQLRREGTLHNYMRMLWGKKVLQWSKTPQEAAERLIELNNKYGVDGRDPNSYSGIFWVFGRFDRPWPERDVFGKVRYMTSESTKRKLKLTKYLQQFA